MAFLSCANSNFLFNKKRNCYKYNSGVDFYGNATKPKTVLRSGKDGGLSMELFVGIPRNLEILTENFGLAVFVHDNWTSPLSVEPVLVNPNVETNIGISRTEIKKVPKPYSDCQDLDSVQSVLKDAIQSKGIAYQQKDCILQCYQNKLIEQCKCYDLGFVCYFNSVVPCANDTCSDPIYEQFQSSEYINTNCMPLCPLECNNTIYETYVSTNGYPTQHYEDTLKTDEQIRAVYYDERM
jgi:hypothetical protein